MVKLVTHDEINLKIGSRTFALAFYNNLQLKASRFDSFSVINIMPILKKMLVMVYIDTLNFLRLFLFTDNMQSLDLDLTLGTGTGSGTSWRNV